MCVCARVGGGGVYLRMFRDGGLAQECVRPRVVRGGGGGGGDEPQSFQNAGLRVVHGRAVGQRGAAHPQQLVHLLLNLPLNIQLCRHDADERVQSH